MNRGYVTFFIMLIAVGLDFSVFRLFRTLAITACEILGFDNLRSTVQPIGNDFFMDDYIMQKEIYTL